MSVFYLRNNPCISDKIFKFLDFFPITVTGVTAKFIVAFGVFVANVEFWIGAFVFVQHFNAFGINVNFPTTRCLRLVRKVYRSFDPSNNGLHFFLKIGQLRYFPEV